MPLLRRSLVCQQAVELVTAYLEDGLSKRDRRRFEAHLADCVNCAMYLAQMRLVVERTGELREEDLDPEARDRFTELFQRWRTES